MRLHHLAGLFFTAVAPCISAATLDSPQSNIRVDVHGSGPSAEETIFVRTSNGWAPALAATSSAVRVTTATETTTCTLQNVSPIPEGLLLTGDCGIGQYEQRILHSSEADLLHVDTRLRLKPGTAIRSMEDRYDFMPERRSTDDAQTGPLDFIWSQNIKSEKDDLIPINAFKSPAVMLQQGEVFAALIPHLSNRRAEPLAMDLDVTSEKHPWISYGAVPSQPHNHSYFRRAADGQPKILDNTVQYSYSIIASKQPLKQGYRRVVRELWSEYGHPALLSSPDAQQNIIRPELRSFASWREDAWGDYANRVYHSFDCGGKQCGTLTSNRNVAGEWKHVEPDAWFNAWFQTLRTAYGWYLHGQKVHDAAMMAKAESVLNLALTAPQKDGAFPTIYMLNRKQWFADDGWAGYSDDYHAFCMSWTAYWMLRWAEDLTPQRKAEILNFVKPYGDFLLREQLPSGVIPSWYNASTLKPRAEFRDFNAETAPSALFLITLATATGDHRYTEAAERAMRFITQEVLPRQRWFDFETYLSCARKDYDFYDKWTAQFPQNNLAEIQAPEAWLALFHATHKQEYLDSGIRSLDYLLLTQQVWNNPLFSPKLLGGFTTQNTDAEWSDARQGYAAVVLFDYFRETHNFEYLERAVAAARSTFAVAPWENWAHTGYIDEPGALTGFHWGTGSAMTSVEMMAPFLADAYIDVKEQKGVGFDECTIGNVHVEGNRISFQIESPAQQRAFMVHFAGIAASQQYRISWNNGPERIVSGRDLLANGYRVGPLHS
ncbi:MAG TPA: hypothetical protein VHB45_00975 [Alloacidobacterium sp.]|nr:hypothetical protein [Alloacidobacterium sp.]